MSGNNFATFCGTVCIIGVILCVVIPPLAARLFNRQWSNLIGRLFTGWGRK